MNSICITGATQAELQIVDTILQHGGMRPPKPANRDESIDMAVWHRKALPFLADNSREKICTQPGGLWEQLAGDLFLANLKSPVWGWADPLSTWLLDFWLNFDPAVKFVLVCSSPEEMLAHSISDASQSVSTEALIEAWQEHHQEILRFHHRNPDRSLLVSVADCVANPVDLVETCISRWRLPLDISGVQTQTSPIDPLALYLASQFCTAYPQTNELQQEVASTLTRLTLGETADQPPPSKEHVIASYHHLRDHSVGLRQAQSHIEILTGEKSALAARQDALQSEVATIAQARDGQASLAAERHLQIEQLCKTNAENSELLLLELHQGHLESEHYFQQHEEALGKIEALTKENSVLAAQQDDLQSEVAVLAQARNEQTHLTADRQIQLDTLTQTHTALTEEKSALAARRDALQNEVTALAQARDEQARLAAERQGQIEQLAKTNAENSELLLLELHQSHLESEHYFQQHEEARSQLQAATVRWQRVLQRNPGLYDYETIEILPAQPDDKGMIAWRVTNFSVAGHQLPLLEFRTLLQEGVAGVVFSRPPKGSLPLVRWPATSDQQGELILMSADTNADILLDLATSDWRMLQKLIALLVESLSSPIRLQGLGDIESTALAAGLAKFGQSLQKLPETVRYDHVELKREQVNPDYEHLWFRFNNLSLGDKRWPQFECRLSCAHVRPHQFGGYPKLEFPEEGSQAPFEAWFIESHDDLGDKLELRFEQPDELDIATWQRLTDQDHAFIAALTNQLPAVLANLKVAGRRLKRPWEDWIDMTKEMQRILVSRTAPRPAVSRRNPIAEFVDQLLNAIRKAMNQGK
jgi:hypothetical protein